MQVKMIARMGAMIIGRSNAARKLDDEYPICKVVYVTLVGGTARSTLGHSV